MLQLEGPDGTTRKMQDDLDLCNEDDPVFGLTGGGSGKTMMDTTIEELKGVRFHFKCRTTYIYFCLTPDWVKSVGTVGSGTQGATTP